MKFTNKSYIHKIGKNMWVNLRYWSESCWLGYTYMFIKLPSMHNFQTRMERVPKHQFTGLKFLIIWVDNVQEWSISLNYQLSVVYVVFQFTSRNNSLNSKSLLDMHIELFLRLEKAQNVVINFIQWKYLKLYYIFGSSA